MKRTDYREVERLVRDGSRRGRGNWHGSITQLAQFKIVSQSDDYLTCTRYNPLDPAKTGESTIVAKPYIMRKTPFHGETITYLDGEEITYDYSGPSSRTATNQDAYSEDEQITPSYFAGDIIMAIQGGTEVNDGDGNQIFWTDLGIGRAWAHHVQPEEA
jgi:hypothetical protein